MKAVLYLSLLTCVLATSLCPNECSASEDELGSYRLTTSTTNPILRGVAPGISKTATDTFYLYGGPGTAEGKFQTLEGSPGGAPDDQGWVSADLTEQTPRWHASTVNCSSTGDGNPEGFTGEAGNYGAISHHAGTVYVGYGNNWDDWLVFTLIPSDLDPAFDPDADTTSVRLTFEYKTYLEIYYDYLRIEWKRGSSGSLDYIQQLWTETGSTYNEGTGRYEKRDFDSDDHGGMVYLPGEYPGIYWNAEDELVRGIQLRIRVTSDGGWSDEDGLFATDGRGAAAVDNIRVYVNGEMVSLADFEPIAVVGKEDLPEGDMHGHNVGAGPGTGGWLPTPTIFYGDFAKIFSNFQDLDVCRDNATPLYTFINDGSGPNNCPGCPIAPSTSPTWNYGTPGGYVVAYDGGLSGGTQALRNYIWSPTIELDLPGTDDDMASGGLVLGFSRYNHLPLLNGIFAAWHVRYRELGQDWSAWKDNGFVYYSQEPIWENQVIDISEHVPMNADQVQIALGVEDLSEVFFLPGDDATPAPLYDNVYLKKYSRQGPIITARDLDLAQDCFPVDGTTTASCRFDAAATSVYDALVPGDSIVVTIEPSTPGAELPGFGGYMFVAHLANPEFVVERAAALAAMGTITTIIDPWTGWPVYGYSVLGQPVTNASGGIVEGKYFFDLMDGQSNGLPHIADELEWIFPGDVLHFQFSSQSNSFWRNLPEDGSGMSDFGPDTAWPRAFTMRALPSVVDGHHPEVLFWNDAGYGAGEDVYLEALNDLCLREGRDFDTYTTRAPSSQQGNGLGSAGFHGATPEQLAGYRVMLYALGRIASPAISDGSNLNGNDMADDLGTVDAWLHQDADRYHAYFGDDFALAMEQQGAATNQYLNEILGVEFWGGDVRPSIDQQTAPLVLPTGTGIGMYSTDFIANGGCPGLNEFDHIAPYGIGPVIAHEFTDPSGLPYPSPVPASVEWRWTDGNGKHKHSIVFPYDLSFVQVSYGGPHPEAGARELLGEVLGNFGALPICWIGVEDPIDLPDALRKFYVGQNHPNPFNPRTRIEFSLPRRGKVRITLYNVRGEKVATLLDEEREAGPGFVDWNGLDARGAEVSSGVYLYKVEAAGREVIKKMALVR